MFFALVGTANLNIATPLLRLKVGLQIAQFTRPFTPQFVIGTINFEVINLSFKGFVWNVNKFLPFCSAVRADFPSLCPEPVLQTGLTEVLPTAGCEVGVTENLGADGRTEKTFRHLLNKFVFIPTILGLTRDTCNSHSDKSVPAEGVGNDIIIPREYRGDV